MNGAGMRLILCVGLWGCDEPFWQHVCVRSMKHTFYDKYNRGKLDARINEALVMVQQHPNIVRLIPSGLAAVFNLRQTTARKLIDDEVKRRGLG
jgi:hypothetical protein